MLTYENMKKISIILVIGIVIGSAIPNILSEDEREVEIKIPAVDNNGKGFVATLKTTINPSSIPGHGKVSVDVNNIVSRLDTQLSARAAVKAAENYLNGEVSNWDILYSIDIDASAVEGTSAGAAMAVSTIAAINKIDIDDNISITGSINDNGNIGTVGAVYQKAVASKNLGVEVFFIPVGQDIYSSTRKDRNCEINNGIELCKILYNQQSTGEELDIEIIEVENIKEIIDYIKN